ncbi:MAG: DNA ligase [Gammaproteobacteria bacterium]|jgi:DNA ligase 1
MKTTAYGLGWLLALLICFQARASAPDLVLLGKYEPGMPVDGWLMSEKLDGIRAWWDGDGLRSRKGNPIAAPAWFTDGLPPFELDGELWIGRGRFEEVQSIVLDETPGEGWRRVTYNVFEVPHAAGGLLERLGRLRAWLVAHPAAHLRIIAQQSCEGERHLMGRLAAVESAGGEGLVLRNPAAPYETGRTLNALKVKRFDDMEARVVGYKPGKGKYSGMTGALRVELEDGTRFLIGSGLSDAERVHPPPVGSRITFRHQGFTARGIPRFASFLRVREGSRDDAALPTPAEEPAASPAR